MFHFCNYLIAKSLINKLDIRLIPFANKMESFLTDNTVNAFQEIVNIGPRSLIK